MPKIFCKAAIALLIILLLKTIALGDAEKKDNPPQEIIKPHRTKI
jgi:hypothetical protein